MKESIQIKTKIEKTELIKVSSFRKGIRKTEPHKHSSYFEIIYLSQGSGSHTIDYAQFPIKPPTVFFVRKEQVHHWDITSVPEGYVLLLKKAFIDKSFDSELKVLLSKISGLSYLHIQDKASIEVLFELLTKESETISENNFSIIEGLLKALLGKILDQVFSRINEVKIKADLFQSFRDLLSQSTQIKNNVAYYAALLNSTPQNLNIACRKAVSQSASEIVAEHIISEAKRLLIYTNSTISDISYSLEFRDPSHFVKYFKRYTGHTPLMFRKL